MSVKPSTPITFCEKSYYTQLYGLNADAINDFEVFMKHLNANNIKLSSIELSVLYALLQMLVQPDFSSPTARLQMLLSFSTRTDYWDFHKKDQTKQLISQLTDKKTKLATKASQVKALKQQKEQELYPYLYGLNYILKHYGQKRTLIQLAQIFQHYWKGNIFIDHKLDVFLSNNQQAIAITPLLKSHFFKGDQISKKGESLSRVNMNSIVSLLARSPTSLKNIVIERSLKDYEQTKPSFDGVVSCNHNIQKFDNSLYPAKTRLSVGNSFGLSRGAFTFLAFSTQNLLDKLTPIGNLPLFKGNSQAPPATFCLIRQSPKNLHEKIILMTNQSSDPAQLTYHLLQYEIYKKQQVHEIDKLLQFSRYLFIKKPLRLIYESNRGTDKQLESLLSLNLPIYHQRDIGSVVAHHRKQSNRSQFILESRVHNYSSCINRKKSNF